MKLGFFLFAEYVNMFVSSAMISTLFFGGYHIPFEAEMGLTGNLLTLLQTGFFFSKILFFIFFFMWIRWTIPRFRFDQLMHLGWKILIPLSIINLLFNGFLKLMNWI
jgi:NADH-quinone oxidoreductase subunit H